MSSVIVPSLLGLLESLYNLVGIPGNYPLYPHMPSKVTFSSVSGKLRKHGSHILFSAHHSANPRFLFPMCEDSVIAYTTHSLGPWASRCELGLGQSISVISPILSIDASAIVLKLRSMSDFS